MSATARNQRTVLSEPDRHTIAFVREFEAPAALLFRAHVDPELVPAWVGPAGTVLTMRHFDPRTGGSWSYVIKGEQGEWAFFGSFHEVTAPSRIVQTFEFAGDPGRPTLETLTFTDLPGGRSRLDGLSLFGSVEERDAMLGGMDAGMDENFDRLDAMFIAGGLA
jgi:uncharacterized protein YndB with AHSA1/START domain